MAGVCVAAMLVTVSATVANAAAVDLDPSFGTRGVGRVDLGHPSVDVATASGGLPNYAVGSAGGNMAVALYQGGLGSATWGNQGRVTADFGRPSVAYAVGEGESSVVAAGSAGDDFARARFSSLDGSQLSLTTTSFGGPAVIKALSRPSVSNLAVGQAAVGAGTSVAMARYDAQDRLDPSFGTGGKVVDDITPGVDSANAVNTVDVPGGGILIAGQAGGSLLLARYLLDGTPDSSFGVGGRVLVDISSGDDVARAMIISGNGIVVAGSAGGKGLLARFTLDGALDPAFGTRGVVISDLPTTSNGFSAAQAYPPGSDGIIVGGTVTGPGGQDAVVVRFSAAGSAVTDFGTAGHVVVDFGSPSDSFGGLGFVWDANPRPPLTVVGSDGADFVKVSIDAGGVVVRTGSTTVAKIDFGRPSDEGGSRVAVQADGRIVVAGWGGSGLVLRRLLADGRVDPTFRPGHPDVPELGRVAVTDLALQPGGGIVAAVTRPAYMNVQYVVRFRADGQLDTTFGDQGRVFVTKTKFALQPDGKILLAGGPRLEASGHVDPTYAVALSIPPAIRVIVLPDGRSVVATTNPQVIGPNLSLYRFNADGSTDTTFVSGVYAPKGRPVGFDRLPDGRFLAVGTVSDLTGKDPTTHVVLSAYDSSGRADTTFGDAGSVIPGFEPFENGMGVVAQPDGKIVVVAFAEADADSTGGPLLEVMRFSGDGRLDRNFGRGGVAISAPMAAVTADVALQADGKILVPATVYGGPDLDLGVMRYDPAATTTRVPRATGWNGVGQLGDATVADHHVPTSEAGLDGVEADGTVWSWGWNGAGQLGDGTTVDRHAPAQVAGLTGVTAIAAGAYHSLALKGDGTVWSWGWNNEGEAGDGSAGNVRLTPVPVAGLTGIKAITAGSFHSLAMTGDGGVWAWGWNGVGQLGDSTTADRHVPARLPSLQGITGVAAGAYHSLALRGDGTVAVWGWNAYGQLGDVTSDATTRPTTVPRLTGVAAVAGGGLHSMALKRDGTVWSWGWNGVGELGDGSVTDSRVPVQAAGLTGVVLIAGGTFHSLALRGDGTVVGWGWNVLGQLGTGTTMDSHIPAPVPGGSGSVAIAGGGLHSLLA
jgi:uncharacterized delta-60 repeat protein